MLINFYNSLNAFNNMYTMMFYYFIIIVSVIVFLGSLIQLKTNHQVINEIKRFYTISETQIYLITITLFFLILSISSQGYKNININVIFFVLFLSLWYIYVYILLNKIKINLNIRIFEIILLFTLLLFANVILFQTYNLFIIFLCIEIISFISYTLVSFIKTHTQSEGGLKYFIFGAIASSFIIFGISFIYFVYGTLQINEIQLLSQLIIYNNFIYALQMIGFLLIIIGLFIKMGVVPFHIWLPDVYTAAPTIITLYLLLVPKVSFLYLTWLLYSINIISVLFFKISVIFIILNLFIGSLMAFRQTNIKQFISYSTIFNNSFFIAPIILNTSLSFFSLILFNGAYIIITILFFLPLLFLRNIDNKEIITNFRNFIFQKKSNFITTIVLSTALFSFAGIPPFVGFFSKYFVLLSSMESSKYFLIIMLLGFSLIASFYYIRTIKVFYFGFDLRVIQLKEYSRNISYLIAIIFLFNIVLCIYPYVFTLLYLII